MENRLPADEITPATEAAGKLTHLPCETAWSAIALPSEARLSE